MRKVLIAVGMARTILGKDSRIEEERQSLRDLGVQSVQQFLDSWGPSVQETRPTGLTHHPNARGCSRDPPGI
jgi:hypothetical protein